MPSDFDMGGGEEMDVFTHMWADDEATWGFDNFDNQDWALWEALNVHDTTNTQNEPSSPATFLTAPSPPPPPPPRISPEPPPRRHAPHRMTEAPLTQQSRRPMGASSSVHNPPTRPQRSPRIEHRLVPRRSRAFISAHREDSTRNIDPFTFLTANPTPPGGISPSFSFDSAEFDDAIDIDDILTNLDSESEAENMPPNTRRRWNGEGVVDLTLDSSPPSEAPSQTRARKTRKRAAPEASQSSKRRKVTSRILKAEEADDIERLDLTNEAPSAEEELAQARTAAAILAQQAAASGPQKIGQRQCIICMENFTNITITSCGHVYCHECLTQALSAGEKNSESGKANCPVCRKPVNRKGRNHVIPLQFMKKSAFRGKARRGMAILG